MKLLQVLSLPFIFLFLICCGEQKADLSSPLKHVSGNVSFEYPKNWTLANELKALGLYYIDVETPGEALVFVEVLDDEVDFSLKKHIVDFSKDFEEQMAGFEVSESILKEENEINGYEVVKEDFSVNLLSESVPHRRIYKTKVVGSMRIMLTLQVATDDYSKVLPGYELICDSFELKGAVR